MADSLLRSRIGSVATDIQVATEEVADFTKDAAADQTCPSRVESGFGTQQGNGYRLKLELGQVFDSQKPVCGGSADLALHGNEGADSPVTQVRAPRREFLQVASSGDHKSRDFSSTVSIKHGGLAGIHTFENHRELTVRLSWFPPGEIAAERNRLGNIECDHLICEEDDWGR